MNISTLAKMVKIITFESSYFWSFYTSLIKIMPKVIIKGLNATKFVLKNYIKQYVDNFRKKILTA